MIPVYNYSSFKYNHIFPIYLFTCSASSA